MKFEIYRHRGDIINTHYLWVYVDFGSPHLKSERNRFYVITDGKTVRTETAASYTVISNSGIHEQVEFDALSDKSQEIISADYPELVGGDEFEKLWGQYVIS